jgi:hypothetical protein
MKHDSNTKDIVRLKKETDDLSFLINEKSRVVADVQQDLGATSDYFAHKEVDISCLQRDVSQKSDKEDLLRKDIETLLFEVSKFK